MAIIIINGIRYEEAEFVVNVAIRPKSKQEMQELLKCEDLAMHDTCVQFTGAIIIEDSIENSEGKMDITILPR